MVTSEVVMITMIMAAVMITVIMAVVMITVMITVIMASVMITVDYSMNTVIMTTMTSRRTGV